MNVVFKYGLGFICCGGFRFVFPVLAFLAANLLVAEASSPANEPKIACATPKYDFGNVGNTAQVTHVFLVVNEGVAPLIITAVSSGCGCTVANASTNVVASGSNTAVSVRFNTANRTGPQRKAVYVQSNDRLNPTLRLELTGELFAVAASNRSGEQLAVNGEQWNVSSGRLDRDGSGLRRLPGGTLKTTNKPSASLGQFPEW